MKNIILFGNTNFTKLIKHYLDKDKEYNVIAVTVEEKYINSNYFETNFSDNRQRNNCIFK